MRNAANKSSRGAPTWGLGDCALGLVPTVLGALALVSSGEGDGDADISVVALVVGQVLVWAFLAGAPLLASFRKGNGPVEDFGLRFKRPDVPIGLVIGVVAQAVLVPLLYLPILRLLDSVDESDVCAEAKDLTDAATGFGIVVLVLIVVVGAPIVEELFYRGLLLRSLENRFGSMWALVGSTVVFGVSHLQGIQLPALLLFGLIAGWLTQRTGRLGPAIFAHMGFNAWTLFVLISLDGC